MKVAKDPSVGGYDGDTQHERKGKPNPFAESWVRQVESDAKTHSDAVRSPEVQRQVPQEGSSYHTHRQRRNAHRLGEKNSTENDCDVVDQGETAWKANTFRTRRTDPKTPPTKKKSGCGSIMRVIRVQSAASSAVNLGMKIRT